jgi:hypothetical protein
MLTHLSCQSEKAIEKQGLFRKGRGAMDRIPGDASPNGNIPSKPCADAK